MGLYELLAFMVRSLIFPFSAMRGISRYAFSFVSNLIFRNNKSLPPPSQLPRLPSSSIEKLESVTFDPRMKHSDKSTSERQKISEAVIDVDIEQIAQFLQSKRKHEEEDKSYEEQSMFPLENSLRATLLSSPHLKPPLAKKHRYEEENETLPTQHLVNEIQISYSQGKKAAESMNPGSSKKSKSVEGKSNLEIGMPRLNYFVAFEIFSPEIKEKILKVQERMLETNVKISSRKRLPDKCVKGDIFKDTFVSIAKLHFTLHVMHLRDDEDKDKARMAVQKVWNECRCDFEENPVSAKVEGIGHFRDRVLFAKLKGEDDIRRLTELANKLRQEFVSINIFGETRPFNPHMTIAKISKSHILRNMNVRRFPDELWKEFEFYNFGTQKVTGIQLLSMQDKNPESGYYQALAEFPF